MLLEMLSGVSWNCGVTTNGDFLAVNAHTCVFAGLNWTRFSRPQSDTLFRVVSILDTSSSRLSSTSDRGVLARLSSALLCRGVSSAVIRITMCVINGQHVINMQKEQGWRQHRALRDASVDIQAIGATAINNGSYASAGQKASYPFA